MGLVWECGKDHGLSSGVTNCSHEIVLVWNVVNEGIQPGTSPPVWASEEHQRAFFIKFLNALKDRMDSGCAHVGLIKYGSCAYIRHELSTDFASVMAQITYIEGSNSSIPTIGLGDTWAYGNTRGWSNLLAAYYQIFQVLNNPVTSKPAGRVYPDQRYKDIVMFINQVWGLDWSIAAHCPESVSMPPDPNTDNPGFTAVAPTDYDILYDQATYPTSSGFYMNPMSWFNANPAPLASNAAWGGGYYDGINWVVWDLAPGNCQPDMGQAQTWFMDNVTPTIHGQSTYWPGPPHSIFNNSCPNCYAYLNQPDVLNVIPPKFDGGRMYYLVMNAQMDGIRGVYDILYNQNYRPTNGPPLPEYIQGQYTGWPPQLPVAMSYFEDAYLKVNACGYDDILGADFTRWFQGDGIYLSRQDWGDGFQGDWFMQRILDRSDPQWQGNESQIFQTMPVTVRGHAYDAGIWGAPVECPHPDESVEGHWECPEGYTLVFNQVLDIWECCKIETTEPVPNDISFPIDLDDEFYFVDTSWTVSYDPKAQAWISFHDWHPELCFPSITHFLTTKTFEIEEVECPRGWTWNPVLNLCEKEGNVDLPATINVTEVAATITGTTGDCTGGVTYWDENTDMQGITDNWSRFCLWTPAKLCSRDDVEPKGSLCKDNFGVSMFVPTGLNTSTSTMNGVPSGDVSNAPGTYFERDQSSYQSNWSGATPGNTRDLGDHAINVVQGEDHLAAFCGIYTAAGGVNPCGVVASTAWIEPYNWFYYNTIMEKYVSIQLIPGGGIISGPLAQSSGDNSGWRTCVFNPTGNNQFGSPAANEYLASDTNWKNVSINSAIYTIDSNDIVVTGSSKAAFPSTGEIKCKENSSLVNGFYSICGFNDYEMEVTLGSYNTWDNDDIFIVLSAYKDTIGQYGPVDVTHFLTLVFNNSANGGNGDMTVRYNRGQEGLAFTNGTDYSTLVIKKDETPFYQNITGSQNLYKKHGAARIRIEKTGTNFKIYTTLTMGTKTWSVKAPGTSNPFGSIDQNNPLIFTPGAPHIEFDLADPNTWTDVQYYATPDALLKFENDGKIGFGTFSLEDTYFVDLYFDGFAVGNVGCDCAVGFTKVYKNDSTGYFTETDGPCIEGGIICRKIECICPPAPHTPSTLVESGVCDDLFLTSADGASGDPNYVNPDPKMCNYTYTEQMPGIAEYGSIWKHNQRCDSFANYYGTDYPWEIELVESTGQAVNTIRSLEYQLECFVYKGNNLNDYECGDDRWHDLDFNFDESVIYNTEQVSGLLMLNLKPKQDPVSALLYPIIGSQDIQILYTKEEQKYRFNQFWDITRDRGEFTPTEQQIWITELNGYIKDLNGANLNYNKAPTQRKKFRHYYNKAILRRRISGNRKMLLKLVNTKLNLSFR